MAPSCDRRSMDDNAAKCFYRFLRVPNRQWLGYFREEYGHGRRRTLSSLRWTIMPLTLTKRQGPHNETTSAKRSVLGNRRSQKKGGSQSHQDASLLLPLALLPARLQTMIQLLGFALRRDLLLLSEFLVAFKPRCKVHAPPSSPSARGKPGSPPSSSKPSYLQLLITYSNLALGAG